MRKCPLLTAVLSSAVLAGSAQALTVIGNWENAPDGWIDWGNQLSVADPTNMPSKYDYGTIGVTLGSSSLKLIKSGWNQNLSIKLQNNGLVDDFMANTTFMIDLTVPATTESGWAKIEEITLNAQGASWGDYKVVAPAFFGWGSGGGGAQSTTLVFDYSAYLSDPDVLTLGHDPWWVEIIITTNSDASHGVFYFDNARLVPEPTWLGLAGLAAGLVIRRRRN